MTWMTRKEAYSATFEDLCDALGYGLKRADEGFRLHSENIMHVSSIYFCYPDASVAPRISGMYFYYHSLAKLFHENLVSKAGDEASCRHMHHNLMYYCHPNRLQKINGCDFIYRELKRSVEKRMTPNYCQYIQNPITHTVPKSAMPKAKKAPWN